MLFYCAYDKFYVIKQTHPIFFCFQSHTHSHTGIYSIRVQQKIKENSTNVQSITTNKHHNRSFTLRYPPLSINYHADITGASCGSAVQGPV